MAGEADPGKHSRATAAVRDGIDEEQLSISSLRSRFEALSAATQPKRVPTAVRSASPKPLDSTREATAAAPTDTVRSIPLFPKGRETANVLNEPDSAASIPDPKISPFIQRPSEGISNGSSQPTLPSSSSIAQPPSISLQAIKRPAPDRPPKSSSLGAKGDLSNGNDGDVPQPSVRSLRGMYDPPGEAGPSRSRPPSPKPESPAFGLPDMAHDDEEPTAPAVTVTIAPTPRPMGEDPLITRSASTQSLRPPPVSASSTRPPSPKPPEPNRSTKPTPRATPTPSPPISRIPSDIAPPQPVQVTPPSPPKLPSRKPTLPTATQARTIPPPLPLSRPSSSLPLSTSPAPILEGSWSSTPSPRLPDRPRSHTVGRELPPRLPTRQATVSGGTSAPRLPSRIGGISTPPIDFAADQPYQPPPPPSRNVQAGSSILSPPRRGSSNPVVGLPRTRSQDPQADHWSGDDDDDDEDGGAVPILNPQAKRMLEDYPDSTNANKRPPAFVPDIRISSSYQIHSFASYGRHVCTGSYHVRVYDTQMSEQPILTVDLKDTGLDFRIKEPRVTAMMFRPTSSLGDAGRYLWCGTKDGHLWELDIRTGKVTDTRPGIHGSPVVNIFRHQNHLLTLEESGKLHVFEVGKSAGVDSPVLIRTVRISDRFTCAKLICGRLWTATAPPNRSTTNTASKGPTIRVYEPCAPGTMPPARTLYTSEWTGAVTSATILPLQPSTVYLAHEGGYVSVWDTEDFSCIQVLKISSTDILSLEGVGERLWAGNRQGQIHVYDIRDKPWQTTNIWNAHGEHAVHELHVDFRAIEESGRFTLWSCARESLRAWDGLLSVDWIDKQLTIRQPDFCTFRDVKLLVLTFNIDSAKPHDLSGTEANTSFMSELLSSVSSPDIIIVGFQEVIPLTDKKLTAKTLLFGGKKDQTMQGDKVSHAYRQWIDKIQNSIRTCIPDTPYVNVHSDNLVGLLSCTFVKATEKDNLKGLDITTVKRGIGGIYGNKGAIVARMVIDDTSICHINVHLAAGQAQKASRNADLVGIMEDKALLPPHDNLPFVHGGDGRGILDHEVVILSGDLNYRIDQRRESVLSNISTGNLPFLLEHDQLRKEMRTNHAFRLRAFEEAPITFNPTYKYNAGSDEYDSSEKRRIPAWCDRILYRKSANNVIDNLSYRRYETTISDHKPVSAGFRLKVKSVDHERMKGVRREVVSEWSRQESEILDKISEALPGIL